MKKSYSLLLFLVIVIIYILITRYNINKYFENFIVTVDEIVLGSNCPDYLAYDGSQYYLVFNNKSFDGINNPLHFTSLEQVKNKLLELKCPESPYIKNMVILSRERNNDDPQETLERKCAKHIAVNKKSLDKCGFEYAFSSPDLSKDFSSLTSEELGKVSNNNLNEIENKIMKMSDNKVKDNYNKIRKLVDFINQNDESVMVDYDLETCMFEKIGDLYNTETNGDYPLYLKQQDLATHKNIHKFRKHFNQEFENYNSSLDKNNNINYKDYRNDNKYKNDDNEYLDEEAMSGFIKYFNDSNNVISDEIINSQFDY
jgi:hypothetical protein